MRSWVNLMFVVWQLQRPLTM